MVSKIEVKEGHAKNRERPMDPTERPILHDRTAPARLLWYVWVLALVHLQE